jgi:hypothetical protein
MDHLFELNGCDHVLIFSIAQFGQRCRVKKFKPDGHDHACHVKLNLFRINVHRHGIKGKLIADGATSLIHFGKTPDDSRKVAGSSFDLYDFPVAKQGNLGMGDDLICLLAHLTQHAPVTLLHPLATVARCRTHQITLPLYEIDMVARLGQIE